MRIERISQRGKEFSKTAESLLRAAQTMTNRAIAGQLKALADDYERRMLGTLMRPKHSLDRRLTPRQNDGRDLTRSVTAQPAEEMRGER